MVIYILLIVNAKIFHGYKIFDRIRQEYVFFFIYDTLYDPNMVIASV